MIDPSVEFQTRIAAMNWAMQTATPGESVLLILDRAMSYAAFVCEPLKNAPHPAPQPQAGVQGSKLN